MITKMESEKLIKLIEILADEKFRDGYLNDIFIPSQSTGVAWNNLEQFIESITETELPITYSVNWNKRGYLPESDGYNGLEDIVEIKDAIISCLEDIVGDDDIENELRQHDLTYICGEIQTWINDGSLEHETILFDSSGDFCVFIYRDNDENN